MDKESPKKGRKIGLITRLAASFIFPAALGVNYLLIYRKQGFWPPVKIVTSQGMISYPRVWELFFVWLMMIIYGIVSTRVFRLAENEEGEGKETGIFSLPPGITAILAYWLGFTLGFLINPGLLSSQKEIIIAFAIPLLLIMVVERFNRVAGLRLFLSYSFSACFSMGIYQSFGLALICSIILAVRPVSATKTPQAKKEEGK